MRQSTSQRKLIQRTALTGLSYTEYALHTHSIEAGTDLVLVAQHNNAHDKYAVAVHVLDESDDCAEYGDQIGWIPKGQNEMLWRMLNAGVDIACRVIAHDRSAPLTTRLFVGNFILVQG